MKEPLLVLLTVLSTTVCSFVKSSPLQIPFSYDRQLPLREEIEK